MLSHFHSGISNSPRARWCLTFVLQQDKHYATYVPTSFFISFHQKFLLRSWYIFVDQRWKLNLLLCASSRITCFNSSTWGTHTLSLNLISPLASHSNSNYFPSFFRLIISCKNWSPCWASWTLTKKSLVIFNIPKYKLFDHTSTEKFTSLNSSINCNSFTIIMDICNNFLLKASTTTFALPGWYDNLKS